MKKVISILACSAYFNFFFFQAEDGIRDLTVTGVQTCALPILKWIASSSAYVDSDETADVSGYGKKKERPQGACALLRAIVAPEWGRDFAPRPSSDRKSTRLNSSHSQISYAVFCLKKKRSISPHLNNPPAQRALRNSAQGPNYAAQCSRPRAVYRYPYDCLSQG